MRADWQCPRFQIVMARNGVQHATDVPFMEPDIRRLALEAAGQNLGIAQLMAVAVGAAIKKDLLDEILGAPPHEPPPPNVVDTARTWRWRPTFANDPAAASGRRSGPSRFAGMTWITEAARRYLAPLIVGEAYPPFKDGLPCYVKLRNAAVPKKLATAIRDLKAPISRHDQIHRAFSLQCG